MPRAKPTRPNSTAVATGAKPHDPATARVVTAVADDVRDLQLNPAMPRTGAEGDVFYRDASGRIVALPAGVAAQVLTIVDELPAWSTPTGGGGVTDGDKGDITVTGGGTIWTLDPSALSSRVPASRIVATTAPLAGGGDLSADRTLSVSTFGAGASGVVPASGGGTSNFLRADATWAAPPGGAGGASVDEILALGALL